MSIDGFLRFWLMHNDSIIQWILFGIILFSTFLLIRLIFGQKQADAADKVLADDLKQTLAKILDERSPVKSSAAPATLFQEQKTPVSVDATAELERREQEIQALKAQLHEVPKDSDSSKYLAKIKELEGKLAEYEILEDDIADLSMFKDENARLKAELETFKTQGAAAAADAPAPAAAPAATEDILAEFSNTAEDATDPTTVSPLDTDKMINEIASLTQPEAGQSKS